MPLKPRSWDRIAARLTPERLERFWANVEKRGEGECWPWKGSLNIGGYGAFSLITGEGQVIAHRIAFGLTHGGIEEGKFVMHTCDNPPCCNPAHLRAATHEENMADMVNKGRSRAQRAGKDQCSCGAEKTAIAKRCRACASVALRAQNRFHTQRAVNRAREARLESLWQIAIRFPATRAALLSALRGDQRRMEVLIHFYGLYGMKHLSLTEIGRRVRLTRERVRQMRNDGLEILGMTDALRACRTRELVVDNSASRNVA